MRRHALLIGALVIAAAPGWAQPAERAYRLVVLSPTARALDSFRRAAVELEKDGIAEGRNLVIEPAIGAPDELPRLAQELVRCHPDVLFAVSQSAVAAAKAATDSIPIVMIASADPVASGWAATLARPGGNVTGVTILGPDLDAKRLQLLRELVPAARRLAVLSDPAITSRRHLDQIQEVAGELGVTVDIVEAPRPDGINAAMRRAKALGAEAVNVLASPMFNAEAQAIAMAATETGLVTMCQWREMAEAGCLASYGPTLAESFRLSVEQVGRLLRGVRVAEIPIEQPTRFELVLNGRATRRLGFSPPPSFVARADEVIE
jgi:putative ABC transport system substrate-binding protein